MSNVYRGVLYLPQATISRKSFDCDRIPPRVAKLALAVGARGLRGALAGPGSPCVLFGTRSDRHSVRSRGATPSAGPTMPDRFQAERRSGAGGVRAPTPPRREPVRNAGRAPSPFRRRPGRNPSRALREGGIEEIEGRAPPRDDAPSPAFDESRRRVSLGTRGGDAMVALRGAFAPPPPPPPAFPPARIARALAVSAHRRLGCRPPAHPVRRKCDGSGRRLVRISPHHFDTEADADEAIEAIRGTLGLPRGGQCESWPLLSWLVV